MNRQCLHVDLELSQQLSQHWRNSKQSWHRFEEKAPISAAAHSFVSSRGTFMHLLKSFLGHFWYLFLFPSCY